MVEQNNLYLMHHGILGQKWGIRRYQNPDGTLTDEGKKKYRNSGLTREQNSAINNFRKSKIESDRADVFEKNYKKNYSAQLAADSVLTRQKSDKYYKKYENKITKLTDSQRKEVEKIIYNYGNTSTTSLNEYSINRGKDYLKTVRTASIAGSIGFGFAAGVGAGLGAGAIYDLATRKEARKLGNK